MTFSRLGSPELGLYRGAVLLPAVFCSFELFGENVLFGEPQFRESNEMTENDSESLAQLRGSRRRFCFIYLFIFLFFSQPFRLRLQRPPQKRVPTEGAFGQLRDTLGVARFRSGVC